MPLSTSSAGRDSPPKSPVQIVDLVSGERSRRSRLSVMNKLPLNGVVVLQGCKANISPRITLRPSSLVADEEISTNRSPTKILSVSEDDTYSHSSMSAGSGTLESKDSVDVKVIYSMDDIKLIEELKVVRHLTRPVNVDVESTRSGKDKPRRKRGNSLERDISRTILQTAAAGANDAHFLVETKPTEDPSTKSAQFILSDLFQDAPRSMNDALMDSPLHESNQCEDQVDAEMPDGTLPSYAETNEYSKSLFQEPTAAEPQGSSHVGEIPGIDDFFQFVVDVAQGKLTVMEDVDNMDNASDDESFSADQSRSTFNESAANTNNESCRSTPQTSNASKEDDGSIETEESDPVQNEEVQEVPTEDDLFQGLESDTFSWREITVGSASKSFEEMDPISEGEPADSKATGRRLLAASLDTRLSSPSSGPALRSYHDSRKENSPARIEAVSTFNEVVPEITDSSLSTDVSHARKKQIAAKETESLNSFGADDDDEWTSFGNSPFPASRGGFNQTKQKQPTKLRMTPKIAPAQQKKPLDPPSRHSTTPRKISGNGGKAFPSSQTMQPASPASVLNFSTIDNASANKARTDRPVDPQKQPAWNIPLPTNDGEERVLIFADDLISI
jgi:hypothetical protein